MRENLIAVVLLAIAIVVWFWVATAKANENNQVMKACLAINGYTPEIFEVYDFSEAAGCYHNWRSEKNKEELAELREFLRHNPRYRYPGQSNNRCFGKPREMPFESAYIERNGNGFRAGVTYKDKLPANCFETYAWDNRNN